METKAAFEKLRSMGQQHLFELIDAQSENELTSLTAQIERINIPTFRMQQQMLLAHEHHPLRLLDPFDRYTKRGNSEDREAGLKLIAEGKAGCLLIAGGQGTRLKTRGPKGATPVSPVKHKSLFQIFAEKTLAAGKRAGRDLPIAIMTSQQNHEDTLSFFAQHALFGLDPMQLDFFVQGTLPLLDHDGNLFLDQPAHIAEGPDGNGSSLARFLESGIWNKWYEKGIRILSFVLIDNPLADPFDAELVGKQARSGSDLVIKCVERITPEESVGVIVSHEGHTKVVEYSEFPAEEKKAKDREGHLKHRLANLSLFSFSMDFVKKAAKLEIPLHLAHKAVECLDSTGNTIRPEKPNAWKFEKFIFDVIPHALKAEALLYPREECFAPLKNVSGEASLEAVQLALQARDRNILSEITGYPAPQGPLELSQEFYYPSEELLLRWKGKKFETTGYIEANT